MSDKRTTYNLLSRVKIAVHGGTEEVDLEKLLEGVTPLHIHFEGDNFEGVVILQGKILRLGLAIKEKF